MRVYGTIEAGGTKFVCGVGTGPDDLRTCLIPTGSPPETIASVAGFIREQAGTDLAAVGIGTFGPADLDRSSPTWGYITSTPKPAWKDFDLAGAVIQHLEVPVAFETDVNAAILGESRWGAAQGFSNALYLTVGTGIGGGATVQGKPVHGLLHPEMGHIRIPHDFRADPFAGVCHFHGDCLEGLASGPAMESRWGMPPEELPPDHPAWALEAHYLGLALANYIYVLSPQKIVIGGGVGQRPHLLHLVQREVESILSGYLRTSALAEGLANYIVTPGLGARSGVLGALALAMELQRSPQAEAGTESRVSL